MNSLGLLPPKPHILPQTQNSTPKALTPFLEWRIRSESSKGFHFLKRERSGILSTTALLHHSEHDVVVVGAGIIGLTIARQLLLQSDLSVAVVDAGLPCSGATGAGQGYIWMAHKTPGSDTWELAMRSKHLWEELAENVRRRGLDPLQVLGWKNTVRSETNGVAEAIHTSKNILYFKKALIIAAGAWSGSLMRCLFTEAGIVPIPVKPRKGHLIVFENFNDIQLNHGLMEVGYIDHQFASAQTVDSTQHLSSVSMTATMDMNGNLVLGSSRQFSGFSKEVEEPIVKSIIQRSAEFFPALNNLLLKLNENGKIRVGFRPYMPDGKPVIGPIPRLPKVFLATGHEGSGLSMALGTAEMVVDMILDNPSRVDCKPFSVEGRFSY